MENEEQRVNGPDQVMVISRVSKTNWAYINKDEHSKRIIEALWLENGGREIPQIKQDKIKKKTTFNYNDEELQIIREMVSNRQDLIDKRKSGKYQESFASQYKITQNPPLFNGAHTHSRQDKLG